MQVARQERDKQRLIKAMAKADDEDASGDAAASPGPQSDGNRPATEKPPTEGGEGAAHTPRDGDEVRQCLEHIVSVCIADAGADGSSEDVAGLGSEAVAVEMGADASEIATGETAGNKPEALLPGFELSAKERKKVSYRCDHRCNNVVRCGIRESPVKVRSFLQMYMGLRCCLQCPSSNPSYRCY